MKKRVIDIIDNIVNTGIQNDIAHLYTEDEAYSDNHIRIHGKQLINFGSYSYLNFDQDIRLKNAAKEAIDKYGLQFGSSRAYLSTTLYRDLEYKIEQIFGNPSILVPTTTLGHIAVMPIVVEEGDVIIMDQNVHTSVQFMIKNLELKGVPNTIIRHNDIKSLEDKIIELSPKYNRVWYMADSVYSMYGDVAPLEKIEQLLISHKQFHFYVDDAHGMSWAGKNGAGYVLSKMKLTSKIILATSLNKAFAAGGSAFVFTDKKLRDRVNNCGGPLIFAGQHLMSALGAGIACCDIHLSSEIDYLQHKLAQKISFCASEIKKRNLPDMSDPTTPIFFIGVGLPKVGYNIIKRLKNKGFHTNLAIFPAVSENCTGIRFSINVNHSEEEIIQLLNGIDIELYEALEEEGRTVKDIEQNFRKIRTYSLKKSNKSIQLPSDNLRFKSYHSIHEIPSEESQILSSFSFDRSILIDLEAAHLEHRQKEHVWKFTYLFAYQDDTIVFASIFTHHLIKEDLMEDELISAKIESIRKDDPYYLCEEGMLMGSPISFGEQMWVSPKISENLALKNVIFNEIQEQFNQSTSNTILLRELNNNLFSPSYVQGLGYVLIAGLARYAIYNLQNFDYSSLKRSRRYYIRKRALEKESLFTISTDKPSTPTEIEAIYSLYKNTHDKNLKLNLFPYSKALFTRICQSNHKYWDIIRIYTKEEGQLIAMSISAINNDSYDFLIAGLDYNTNIEYDSYSQLIHQLIQRAKGLKCNSIELGYTTAYNKMKFGAMEIDQSIYSQSKDNFSHSKMELISNHSELRKSY